MIYLKRVSICVVRRHSFLVASHLISGVTFYLWRHILLVASQLVCLPDFALVFGVHGGADGASENVGKLFCVGQDPDHPEPGWRVRVLQDLELVGLGSGGGTPDLEVIQ